MASPLFDSMQPPTGIYKGGHMRKRARAGERASERVRDYLLVATEAPSKRGEIDYFAQADSPQVVPRYATERRAINSFWLRFNYGVSKAQTRGLYR